MSIPEARRRATAHSVSKSGASKPRSVGRSIAGYEVAILDDSDAAQPAGLTARSASARLG
jgi:hypothetical protein